MTQHSTVESSLADDAYNVVRRRIVSGELRLGSPLSRRKLAAELKRSFLPVSMALLRLEYEGFLESRPRAGTRVRIPTREDLRGHYLVREALEMQAAKLFAEGATDRDRQELCKLGVQVDALSVRPNPLAYVRMHQRFHRRIAEGARCPVLSRTIDHTHALASIWFCAVRQTAPTELPRRHQELAEVLTSGDPDRAVEAIREHIAGGLQHALQALKPYFTLRRKSSNTFVRSGMLAS
jgi:DNA-binding GntR family transcriptional regulator